MFGYGFCFVFLSLPKGSPGEKGSSDIIDFNGKLLDAFRVSVIKVSINEARLIVTLCIPLWIYYL